LRVPPEGPGSRFSGMPIVVRCLFLKMFWFFLFEKKPNTFSQPERENIESENIRNSENICHIALGNVW